MSRALLVALASIVAIAGCGAGGVGGEAHFESVTTQHLPIRVRITGVVGDSASIAILADVAAPGSEWVALTGGAPMPGVGASTGVAQRTIDGAVQLERSAEWFSPQSCAGAGALAACELDFVLSLDAPPTTVWRASVFVTVAGDTEEGASVELLPTP
jgi:hypothetical protein